MTVVSHVIEIVADLRVLLVRLAGFEPATRCLEDVAQVSRGVSYVGTQLRRVRAGPMVSMLVGVTYRCHCPSSNSRIKSHHAPE